jgi:hypothetical protein
MVGTGEMAEEVARRATPNITIVPRLGFDECGGPMPSAARCCFRPKRISA